MHVGGGIRLMKCCRWIALVVTFAGAVTPVPAQTESAMVVRPDGTQFFRNLLHLHGLEPVPSIEAAKNLPPEQTVIIIFGNLSRLPELNERNYLWKFTNKNGALLIASDRPDYGHLGSFQVELMEEPLEEVLKHRVRNHPQFCYQGDSRCPKISPYYTSHPIFRNIKKTIVANQPCRLKYFGGDYSRLAQVRAPVRPIDHLGHHRFGIPCMVGTSPSRHPDKRVLFLNGHGVFMNQMVALDDTDNARFAINTIRWISENGKRKYVLLIEEGFPQTKFNVGLAEPPFRFTPDMIDPMLVLAERMLHGLEREDAFDKMSRHYTSPDKMWLYLLLAFSVFVVFRGLLRLAHGRYHKESKLPLVSRTLEKNETEVPLTQQRQSEARSSRNLSEAAQMLIRQWFEQQGVDPLTGPPKLAAASNWHKSQVKALWQLAFGKSMPTVTAKQLRDIYEQLQSLHRLCKNGKLRFRTQS